MISYAVGDFALHLDIFLCGLLIVDILSYVRTCMFMSFGQCMLKVSSNGLPTSHTCFDIRTRGITGC